MRGDLILICEEEKYEACVLDYLIAEKAGVKALVRAAVAAPTFPVPEVAKRKTQMSAAFARRSPVRTREDTRKVEVFFCESLRGA